MKKSSSGQVLELHRRIQEGPLPSLGLTENENGSFVCRSSGTDHLRMGSRQAPGNTAKVMGSVLHTVFSLGVSWSDQSYFLRGPDGEGRVIGKTISQEAISGVQKLKVLPLWGNLHGNRGLLATKMPPSIGIYREVANSLFHLLQ